MEDDICHRFYFCKEERIVYEALASDNPVLTSVVIHVHVTQTPRSLKNMSQLAATEKKWTSKSKLNFP